MPRYGRGIRGDPSASSSVGGLVARIGHSPDSSHHPWGLGDGADGELPTVRIGRARHGAVDDLRSFIAQRRVRL